MLASQYDKIPTTIVSISVQNFIASLFVYAAITIESVILLFRYMLLSALYIIGPLAITLGLWTPTSSITKGWFTTLFQLSFWVITLRVLEATMLSLNANSILQNGGTAEYILISALVITLVAMTPLITERLISGANISLMGGIAMATFTTVTAKWGGHAAAGHKALFGKEGVITKTYSNIKDRVSSWRSSGKSTPKESEPEEQHRR